MRTWAVKGQSPVVQFHFNWDHVSIIAGLHRVGVTFRLHDGAIRKEEVVEFLKALKAHHRRRLLIIWDGAKPHRSHLVRDDVDSTNGDIVAERLPACPPAHLSARAQPGRISVGLAQATCPGQLLSRHP